MFQERRSTYQQQIEHWRWCGSGNVCLRLANKQSKVDSRGCHREPLIATAGGHRHSSLLAPASALLSDNNITTLLRTTPASKPCDYTATPTANPSCRSDCHHAWSSSSTSDETSICMIDYRELPTAVRVHGPGLHAHILAPEKRPSPVTSGSQINIEFLHIHFSGFPRRQHICISTTSGTNSSNTITAPRSTSVATTSPFASR